MDDGTFSGLEQIYKRDGAEIFNEASRDLLLEVLRSIEYFRGALPNSWRGMMRELIAEQRKEENRFDARLMRRRVRPAVAA